MEEQNILTQKLNELTDDRRGQGKRHHRNIEKNRGRIELRETTVFDAPEYLAKD